MISKIVSDSYGLYDVLIRINIFVIIHIIDDNYIIPVTEDKFPEIVLQNPRIKNHLCISWGRQPR